MRAEVFGGRFALLERAGAGGMGEVWRARDRDTGALVALKLSFEHRDPKRFLREARVLEGLSHPAIVRHLAHGVQDDLPWIAMEWLEGEDLSRRLDAGPLSVEDTLAILGRLAAGLAVAHRAGVIHRDVKPANVVLAGGRPEGATLLDFGIARAPGTTPLTRPGGILGTPGFMAPEQIRGDPAIDARADVFALGCVAYACLAAHPPWRGEGDLNVLVRTMLETPPPIPGLSPALDRLLAKLLAKLPDARPEDAGEVAAILEGLDVASRDAGDTLPARVGLAERVFVTIGVAAAPAQGEDAPTMSIASDLGAPEELDALAGSHGVRAFRFLDGTVVMASRLEGSAPDRAAAVARAILALARRRPGLRYAVATGRALGDERAHVGEAADGAIALLGATPGRVALDEVTAGLVAGRFELDLAAGGFALVAERRAARPASHACVGRDRELAQLEDVFEECVDEAAPRVAWLDGALGAGKSRVCEELVARLRARASVFVANGHPSQTASSFELALAWVRALIPGEEAAPIERARLLAAALARALSGEAAARTAEVLAERLGLPIAAPSPALRAARVDPVVMGDALRAAFEAWLDAECSAGPVALVLDDVQWADAPSLRLVATLARRLRRRALFVLCAGRPEARDALPELSDAAAQSVRLAPLRQRAARELARAALGPSAEDAAIERVVERGEGNPLVIEELVRAEREGRRDVPPTVAALLEARLAALPAPARRVLRAAAIFGGACERDGIAAVLGEPAASFEAHVQELIARDVLDARGERLAFRHPLARDVAYEMLPLPDRRAGHRLAAEHLEARRGDPMALVEHFERAGLPSRAAPALVAGARDALEGGDLRVAIERAERAIVRAKDAELEGRAGALLAEACAWIGEHERAAREAAAAIERLAPGTDAWDAAAAELAEARFRTGDRGGLLAFVDALRARLGPRRGEPGATALAHRVAGLLPLIGVSPAALLSAVGPPRDAAGRGWAAVLRAGEAQMAGDALAHLDARREATGAFAEAGLSRWSLFEAVNLGYAYLELGCDEEAIAALEAGRDAADRLGLASIRATAEQNLGLALARIGRLDEAIAIGESAVEAFASQGNLRMEGASLVYLGRALADAGRLEDAAQVAARAEARLRAAGSPIHAYALALRAALALEDTPALALAWAREAMAIVAREGHVEEGEAYARLAFARALAANGDAGAAAAWDEARERLRERADAIVDPAMRARFEAIPEHAATRGGAPGVAR